ncbi:uncharacterized protein LOC134657107 [Cydia amplana]|uniref:uncharacterized protein LOC134657107 n=1 Tax=Cydia amplana TaxID=1869771 RepID=UPI002FE64AF4
MLSQNFSEVNYAQRAKVPQRIGDLKCKITESFQRKCPYKTCNKAGCRKFWHTPYAAYDPGFVGQLWPTVLAVGIAEIFFGVILISIVIANREKYDSIYGVDAANIISLTSIVGLVTLIVCGVMLLLALILDMRRIMWIRILTSTGLGGYVVILSVLKMHFALLAIEREPSVSITQAIILSDASMLEVFTLLGAVLHFFGDIAVFTYYNLRYLQPTLFYTGQVENI